MDGYSQPCCQVGDPGMKLGDDALGNGLLEQQEAAYVYCMNAAVCAGLWQGLGIELGLVAGAVWVIG